MTVARVRPIGGLPLAGQLDGTETLPAAQGGASVAITAQKLAGLAATLVPPGNATKDSVGLGNVANLSPGQLAQAGNPVGDEIASKAPLSILGTAARHGVETNGDVRLSDALKVGTFLSSKFISQPDEIQAKGPISAIGGLSITSIAHVDMGASSVPAGLLETSLAGAWPSLVIRNNSRDPASQTQIFIEKRDPSTGDRRIWQLAHDVEDNGGWPGLFNIEYVDPTLGVLATPLGMARTGQVSSGGLPLPDAQFSVRGNVRSYAYNSSDTLGRFDFGKTGANYIVGDTAAGYVGVFVNNSPSLVLTANGTSSSGVLTAAGNFAVNGVSPLPPVALPANATDLATAIALVNKLKEMATKSGLAVSA